MSEGPIVIPAPTGDGGAPDFKDLGIITDLFGTTLGTVDRNDPWENARFVKRVMVQVFGCPEGSVDAAFRSDRRKWRLLAKDVFLLDSAQRGRRLGAFRQHFRKNPGRLENITGILNGTIRSPCPPPPPVSRFPRDRLPESIRRRLPGAAATPPRGSVPSQVPPGTQRPPGPIRQRRLQELLDLVVALREWWIARERLKQQEDEARRARRAARRQDMSGFGDFLSGFGSGLEGVVTTALQNAGEIADLTRAVRGNGGGGVRPVSFTGGGAVGGSGVPLPGPGTMAGGAALALFDQPGAMDPGGLLEGFENELEREAVFFRRPSGSRSARSVGTIDARNPDTDRIHFFKDMGRPVLFKGDIAACRRVRKVARQAASSVGLRFRPVGRRRR